LSTPITLTLELRAEYERLYAEADILSEHQAAVTALATHLASDANWPRYSVVADALGIPPHVVVLIHAMESSADFTSHLHNGDPLSARTIHAPAGRPETGEPPYTWEASAMDALRLHHLDEWHDWSIAGLCYVLERYNGWGYRKYHKETKSPYLWSFTSIYTAGKYVADGKWSATAVSQQVGAVALLMEIIKQGQPYPVEVAHAQTQDVAATPAQPSPRVLPPVPDDAVSTSQAVGQPVGNSISALLVGLTPILRTLSTSKTMAGVVGLAALQFMGQMPQDMGFYVGGNIYHLPDLHPYLASALAALATWGRITAKPAKEAKNA
jgi:lysozyme family protein